jgi:hypothetical protein
MLNECVTTETDVAAFLMSKEHELRDIRVLDDQCSFVFASDAAPVAEAYRRGAHVVAQTFARQRYALLGLIAEAKAKAKLNPSISPAFEVSNVNARRR